MENNNNNVNEQPTTETIKSPHSSKKVLVILIIALLAMIVGFTAGYLLRSAQDNSNSKSDPQVQKSSPNNRGVSGVKKQTKNSNAVAADILQSLALSFKRDGQYPEDNTEYMLQIMWKDGYTASSMGKSMECPEDKAFFSYEPIKDQNTEMVNSFNLYYCDDTELVVKTEKDIIKYINS